ncbi:MAG: hypothetical protein ACE5I3_13650 [Phycisphaerae bacterium]
MPRSMEECHELGQHKRIPWRRCPLCNYEPKWVTQHRSIRDRLVSDTALRKRLAAEPHPNDRMAARGHTRLSWAESMFQAGHAERMVVAYYIATLK